MPTVTEAPNMSASTRNVLGKVRRMVPPLLDTFHKGQLGRVAVIGGSEDYTGAPYFSAMASARLGCDMSHVICTPAAAAVIKTYSPNLMVHPLMRQSAGKDETDADPDQVAQRINEMLGRLHVLVVGPGLGRDPLMQATVARVIKAAREAQMPVVLDADALQLVQKDPDVIRGYKHAVLTPNVVEFKRLCDALKIDVGDQTSETGKVERLARELGGVTIIQKGVKDFISNGNVTLVSDLQGGKKRSAGQGDTLTGAIATFLGWRKAYHDGLWKDHEKPALEEDETMGLAAFAGSAITRECSRLAYGKKGRSLQASDLTDEVHSAFMGFFGEVDGDTARL
ncbi:carbohydrate kinase [Trichoderma austrokoningii]